MLFSLQKFTDKILENTEKEEEGRENPTAPSPGGGGGFNNVLRDAEVLIG